MPREFSRTIRVAQNIRRALAPVVSDWARDRHAGMASITDVDVSPDLKRSNVFVSLYDCPDSASAIGELNDETWRFRRLLGKELRLRTLPELKFRLDESIEGGDRLSQMLSGLDTKSNDQ